MKNIIWEKSNSNGVSMYKAEYLGQGIYDVRISAKNIEVGDKFHYIMSEFTIVEIKDQHISKSTDKSMTVYDMLIKSDSWTTDLNYRTELPSLRLPIPADFDVSPK